MTCAVTLTSDTHVMERHTGLRYSATRQSGQIKGFNPISTPIWVQTTWLSDHGSQRYFQFSCAGIWTKDLPISSPTHFLRLTSSTYITLYRTRLVSMLDKHAQVRWWRGHCVQQGNRIIWFCKNIRIRTSIRITVPICINISIHTVIPISIGISISTSIPICTSIPMVLVSEPVRIFVLVPVSQSVSVPLTLN